MRRQCVADPAYKAVPCFFFKLSLKSQKPKRRWTIGPPLRFALAAATRSDRRCLVFGLRGGAIDIAAQVACFRADRRRAAARKACEDDSGVVQDDPESINDLACVGGCCGAVKQGRAGRARA